MPEENPAMAKAKNLKPEIEDVIGEVLSGDVLKNARSLIGYLRAHKMNPAWSAANVWKISYKTYTVCFIRLYGAAEYHGIQPGTWQIIPFIGEYEPASLSDESKETVWSHQRTCANCGKCALPLAHVFGRRYDYACEKSIVFTNPGTAETVCIEKLLELRRNSIREGRAQKHKYIAQKDR